MVVAFHQSEPQLESCGFLITQSYAPGSVNRALYPISGSALSVTISLLENQGQTEANVAVPVRRKDVVPRR